MRLRAGALQVSVRALRNVIYFKIHAWRPENRDRKPGNRGKTGDRRDVLLTSDDRSSNSATVSGKMIRKRPVCPCVSS